MSQQVKQPKETKNTAEIKRKYVESIHRRIISFSWILMKNFGYEIEINRESRTSKLTFPYYLVSKITSKEGITLFDSNKLLKKFQMNFGSTVKKQAETNWVKKILNNKLIDILTELKFTIPTKSTKQNLNKESMEMDKRTTLKPNHICYGNKRYEMEFIEKTIGDEANGTLKHFFNTNKDEKYALFYLNNENVVISKFNKNNQVIELPTEIYSFYQTTTIQFTPYNENSGDSNEFIQQLISVDNTVEIYEQEQNSGENVSLTNDMNVENKIYDTNQISDEYGMCQQPIYFSHCYYGGIMYNLTPISCNNNIPDGFYASEMREDGEQQIRFIGDYLGCGPEKPILYQQSAFSEGLLNNSLTQPNTYQQNDLTQNQSF
ncbi:hypothetical protein QTN25_007456 [Entamoeba marina]